MSPSKKTRSLARSLVTRETHASQTFAHSEPATARVYEKLRRQLSAPVGSDGFRALASRALVLARAEAPQLETVQVAANGDLHGLGQVDSRTGADEFSESGVILIARLLELFLTFLGEATTLRLIEDIQLQADAQAASGSSTDDPANPAANEPIVSPAFEDVLAETDRLRSVSEAIEVLAVKHPEMQDGFTKIAESIRNMAKVLDVFTMVRSLAGETPEEVLPPSVNDYVN